MPCARLHWCPDVGGGGGWVCASCGVMPVSLGRGSGVPPGGRAAQQEEGAVLGDSPQGGGPCVSRDWCTEWTMGEAQEASSPGPSWDITHARGGSDPEAASGYCVCCRLIFRFTEAGVLGVPLEMGPTCRDSREGPSDGLGPWQPFASVLPLSPRSCLSVICAFPEGRGDKDTFF